MKNTFKLKAILNNENVITLIDGGDKSAFSFAVAQRFNKRVR